MQFIEHENPKYFTDFVRGESLVLDSSRIVEYKRCPRAYFFRYVINLTSEDNICWFVWGGSYHKFREILEIEYNKNCLLSSNKKENCQTSFHAALTATTEYWKKKIEKDGQISYPAKKFEFMTLERLIQSCIVAYAWWEKEKLSGNIEVLEIEQPFTFVLPNGIAIGGRFDQIVRTYGRLYDRDFKTSSTNPSWYANGLLPSHQFSLYDLALNELSGKPTGGIIIEALFTEEKDKKNSNPSELRAFPLQFTREGREKFKLELMHTTELMELSRQKDMYPANEASCNRCQFRQVCQAGSETAMTSVLKLKYKHRIWDHNSSE
jgi:hypothetical protein